MHKVHARFLGPTILLENQMSPKNCKTRHFGDNMDDLSIASATFQNGLFTINIPTQATTSTTMSQLKKCHTVGEVQTYFHAAVPHQKKDVTIIFEFDHHLTNELRGKMIDFCHEIEDDGDQQQAYNSQWYLDDSTNNK